MNLTIIETGICKVNSSEKEEYRVFCRTNNKKLWLQNLTHKTIASAHMAESLILSLKVFNPENWEPMEKLSN